MNKWIVIVLALAAMFVLAACGKTKEPTDMEHTKTVTLINNAQDGDVWILPETEENLKTTLWGTATAAEVKTGESRQVALPEPGDEGRYIFRMIDTDGNYYSADGLTLEDGQTLQIGGDDLQSVTLAVADANGETIATYAVFVAKL